MGWRRRPGVLPLAGGQDGRHGVSGDPPTPNSHECADNVAGHVLQKAVRTEHKDEARSVPGAPQMKERAPRAARRTGRSSEGRKIVIAYEDTGRCPYSGEVERLWHVPGIGGA